MENNLTALLSVLTDPAIGGRLPGNCTTISDSNDPGRLGVTLAESAAAAHDTLVVYYAGHGLLDERGELYLGLRGTNPDHPMFTSLPFEWVRRAILASPARNRVLLLDCCFSGRAIEAMADPGSAGASQIEISGTYTLTSAPANRTSVAPVGAEHTAFTGELLALLRRGIPGGGEVVTLSEIYRILLQAHAAAGLPKPQQRNTETAEKLALARNVALVPEPTSQVKLLHRRHLPRADLQPNPRWVPIGYAADEPVPVYADFYTDQHFVVLGDAGVGKTNVLRGIAGGLTERYSPKELVFALVDFHRTLLGFLPEQYLLGYGVHSTQLSAIVSEMISAMRKREGGQWGGPELFVVVDDYDSIRGPDNPLLPFLELLPRAHEIALHLVVAAEPTDSASDPLLTALETTGTAALLMSGQGKWRSARLSTQPMGHGTFLRDARTREVRTAWIPYEQATPTVEPVLEPSRRTPRSGLSRSL
ncbi:caspase family protein [Amycolatopsis sp. FDAARGOS 1241]|uniref:caspase, EACC1-associated type n=1 Tax=Amycolatopsis sp. FDAARGOS 1241 TaxID=2778070 RepID=UPI0019528562|nr:caspase family protein [Amycolatopsis sp. FDAARGOS 1241]QRP49038.1 caspase family protein [Amycolatopsis sp. FDAARGOS 1241]